jgi:hypothetical protein
MLHSGRICNRRWTARAAPRNGSLMPFVCEGVSETRQTFGLESTAADTP